MGNKSVCSVPAPKLDDKIYTSDNKCNSEDSSCFSFLSSTKLYFQYISNIVNKTILYLGNGIFGSIIMIGKCTYNDLLQFLPIVIIGIFLIFYYIRKNVKIYVNRNNVVIITGCDSGLGYNIAIMCYNLNMTVIACCFNKDSEGAFNLKELCPSNRLIITELDITKNDNIISLHNKIQDLLTNNKDYVLTALVNNAGMLIFGEFEWLTSEQVFNLINTNLLGTMNVTKTFLPLLRKYKGRIINVTSHCALQALPGLSVYCASKAGLLFWTDSLRQELKKYCVKVVNYIPGSFIMSSNILYKQDIYATDMINNFTSEQVRFYSCFFYKYMTYLSGIINNQKTEDMQNTTIMRTFEAALLDKEPYAEYKAEPLRYKVYHFLFKITPTVVRDWLVLQFIKMPQYVQTPKNPCGCCVTNDSN